VGRALSDDVSPDQNIVGALMIFHYPEHLEPRTRRSRHLPRRAARGTYAHQLTTKWLVHRGAQAGRDHDREKLTRVWGATNEQDPGSSRKTRLGWRGGSQSGPEMRLTIEVELGFAQYVRAEP
jgi:hypothetical protein